MQTVLVIDDEEGVRDAFRLALAGRPYRVATAADGEAGIAAAREQRPDLVLLDLRMPGLDGVETLRRLLADDPTLKVCIQTAFHAEYLRALQQAATEGLSFELVRKPLDTAQIRTIVDAWLGGDATSSASAPA